MNARENPFASSRIEAIPFVFPDGDDWNALIARLSHHGWRASIIGPHGTGKTTLLEQLAPRLATLGFKPHLVTLNTTSSLGDKRDLIQAVRGFRSHDFLLLDGEEQLLLAQFFALKNAAKKCGGMITTRHRRGSLPAIFETQPTAALLRGLVVRLTGATLDEKESVALLSRQRFSIRDCFRELYDR
ncbi:MAG TPA: hypothetical protein VIT21_10895, partial [Chthoniobacterales bacterium]